jgi:Zn-dependent protease/predicted transcriptional regulator
LGRTFRIGTVGGIPVFVDGSWIIIALLFGWTQYETLSTGLLVAQKGHAATLALLFVVLFFLSIFLHEGAHAASGRALDIPVHGITLVFFGGFTQVDAESRGPWASFVVAAAGPTTSLVLGAGMWLGTWAIGYTASPLMTMVHELGVWNLYVAALNFLPGLPLDGGRILRAGIWGLTRKRNVGTRVATVLGEVIGVALLGLGVYRFTGADPISGIWVVWIGLFLFQSARTSDRYERQREGLEGVKIGLAMATPPMAVPVRMSLTDCLETYLRGHEEQTFPVVDNGRLIGMLDFASAARVGSVDPLRPVGDAMLPLDGYVVVEATAMLGDIAPGLLSGGAALVVHEGMLVGMITGEDVKRWRRTHGTDGVVAQN